jgi:hypothetical protein
MKSRNSLEKRSMENGGILTNNGMRPLEKADYQLMIFQYPVLRHFIFQCWRDRADNHLLDFLFALETDDHIDHPGH